AVGGVKRCGRGDRRRRGAPMPEEEPTQVTAGDAQPFGQGIDRGFLTVESASLDDQARCAFDGGQAAFPRRAKGSGLRAAAQARTEPGGFSGCSTRHELNVAAKRQPYRADATAVNPGRANADEETTIERRIACGPTPVE